MKVRLVLELSTNGSTINGIPADQVIEPELDDLAALIVEDGPVPIAGFGDDGWSLEDFLFMFDSMAVVEAEQLP